MITRPRGAVVTPATPIFQLYYPDVLCINTTMEVDIIFDDEPTIRGRSPRSERRAAGGIATATSNITMSLGNEMRPNLFPGMGRSRWGRLPMSGVFVYKGTLNVGTTASPKSVNTRHPSITQ